MTRSEPVEGMTCAVYRRPKLKCHVPRHLVALCSDVGQTPMSWPFPSAGWLTRFPTLRSLRAVNWYLVRTRRMLRRIDVVD